MSDWMARKLAERLNQPAPARQAYPQPGYPPQTVAPQTAYPQASPPQVPNYQAPGQTPGNLPQVQEVSRVVDPNNPFDTAMRAALAAGDQHRTSQCPECHQDTLIQITTNESGYPLRMLPAPSCSNCGWPRMQAGSIHGGASLMKPQGRAKAARQLTNHVVRVDYDGIQVGYEPQAGGQSYV